jgi:hypothetical protein
MSGVVVRRERERVVCPRCDQGRLVTFIEVAVDIARTVGLVEIGKKILRKVLENARVIAKSPTITVSAFVVVE